MKLPLVAALGVVLLLACASTQPGTPNPTVTAAGAAITAAPATGTPATDVTATASRPRNTATPLPQPSPSASALASASTTSTRTALPPSATAPAVGSVPRPDHVVVLIFENKPYAQIFGDACCPYINQQANVSALMTRSFAVTHPSQPNYLDLFSGSDQGVTDDACPAPGSPYTTPNLGQQLLEAGFSFAGYSEDLPAAGSGVCSTDTYARKHNPWSDFSNVPGADNLPFSSFPSDFTTLPTVSIISPNLCNDMHDCAPNVGDDWISGNLDSYIQWAPTHNSLLIVTFDEDDYYGTNQVVTFFEGARVKPGQYHERITHYNVLRTIEAMYALPYAGEAAHVATITDIWAAPPTPAAP